MAAVFQSVLSVANRMGVRLIRSGVLASLLISGVVWAEGEEGGGGAVPYVDLAPSFVTNFGGTSAASNDGPRFIKVDIALRVPSSEIADEVKYHMPALRNYILLLLAAQDVPTMTSPLAQTLLRAAMLKGINKILKREDGAKVQVTDVFFTGFVIQQ